MPLDEEFIIKDAVIVQLLAQRNSELLLLRALVDHELNDGLEEVLQAVLFVLAHQVVEDALELVPARNNVAMGSEKTADTDVEFVLRGNVKLKLRVAHLLEHVVCLELLSFLLSHESFEFFTSGHYNGENNGYAPVW